MRNGITLVLGSGGARGLSFIGVISELEEHGIAIDRVIGTSMGAMVGGAYCCRPDAERLRTVFAKISAFKMFGGPSFGPGLISHSGVLKFVRESITCRSFEELEIPLQVFCTDLVNGKSVSFSAGPIVEPIVGSSLAAGVFTPISFEGMRLVDGGYTQPIGVEGIGGDDIAVIVDPSVIPNWQFGFENTKSLLGFLNLSRMYQQVLKSYDILIYELTRKLIAGSDLLVVAPDLENIAFSDFGKREQAIEAGRRAIQPHIDTIRSRLKQRDANSS